jgi:geranylgeranyl reductase family protein
MDACDVLIVGGGPAGSSCAWALRNSGLRVAILDRQTFPRDKVCGGWITPAVLQELEIDPGEYARTRVLQPITGFRTSSIGGPPVETRYQRPVSYGIRRFEFDDYLLKRSGACLVQGESLTHMERSIGDWILNGRIKTRLLVGAGGTFCPVARYLGARVNRETIVTAQEAEFEMDARQISGCSIQEDTPELYFCRDLKGYGWCFRKKNILNVGLGRLDPHRLSAHVADFLKILKTSGRLLFDLPSSLLGHAYLLSSTAARNVVDEGILLIGDAAGVAYAQSGEGIRPAVESGLLAAKVIADAHGQYSREQLEIYRSLLFDRFHKSESNWLTRIGGRLPAPAISAVARWILARPWFARNVVLNTWFLRQNEPTLSLP